MQNVPKYKVSIDKLQLANISLRKSYNLCLYHENETNDIIAQKFTISGYFRILMKTHKILMEKCRYISIQINIIFNFL